MDAPIELFGLFNDATARRSWLLSKALECVALDRAIDLARRAELFITGAPGEDRPADKERASVQQPAVGVARPGEIDLPTAKPPSVAARQKKNRRTGLSLSLVARERLLERLAQGARNSEIASEFGLALRQVQGIRVGAAREIARRRERQADASPQHTSELPRTPASAEDVVRYLRQQNDVVVPNGDGQFMINGRFRLGVAELIERANKMRRRQAKPEFELAGRPAIPSRNINSGNAHPIFWREPKPGNSGSKPTSMA